METKDELLSEGEKYFEKVMQDFNQSNFLGSLHLVSAGGRGEEDWLLIIDYWLFAEKCGKVWWIRK